MTYEKLYAVYSPMKASQHMLNQKRSKIIATVALLICSLINTHFLFSHSIIEINTHLFSSNNESFYLINLCTNKIWFDFYDKYWPYIDATIYSFLPLILISTFNITIIIRLIKENKKSSKLQKIRKSLIKFDGPKIIKLNSNVQTTPVVRGVRLSSNYSVISLNSTVSKSNISTNNEISLKYIPTKSTNRHITISEISYQNGLIKTSLLKTVKKYKHGNRRMTLMIFFINTSFCVLTLPIVTLQIIYQAQVNYKTAFFINNNSSEINTIDENMEENFFNFLKSVCELFQYLNHGINFILYCLIGKTFRRATKTVVLKFLKLFIRRKS